MFGSGTACIISPISSIDYKGELIHIPTMEHTYPVFRKFRDEMYAIFYGHKIHPWAVPIE